MAATKAALDQAIGSLGGQRPVAAIVFAAVHHDHQAILHTLAERLPGVPLVGCTTDGELSSSLAFQEDSLALMLFAGDGLRAKAGIGRGLSSDSGAAARAAVAMALADEAEAPRLCIAFPESLTASAAVLVGQLNRALPASTMLVGGTAGDQWQFEKTHQFFQGEVTSDSVPVLMLFGAFEATVGVASGWATVGQAGCITRAAENVVHEIDGVPAMDFYTNYFGDAVEATPEFPLGVLDGDQFYLRAPMGTCPDSGAVTFAGDVPEGSLVHISAAERDAIVHGCKTSLAAANDGLAAQAGHEAAGVIIISCAARKQLLGTRTDQEYSAVRKALGDVPVIGFYSYGEIAPFQDRTVAHFHNETFVTVVLRPTGTRAA